MNKTEFKVGEVFEFGLIRLQCCVNPNLDSCKMCYFINPQYCDEGEIGQCVGEERKDKTDVIFKEIDE